MVPQIDLIMILVFIEAPVVLGGSRDLVTSYSWGYNPTLDQGNPCKAIWGDSS